MPELLLPFGPFHMVLLHLPIGALAAIWFVEIFLEKNTNTPKNKTIGLLHLFLLLSAGLTIALGLAYEDFGNYGEEIEAHEFWGLVFGGCILLTYLLYWTHRLIGRRSSRWLYILSLMGATISMVITGHLGAELIHGKGFLSKPFKADKRDSEAPPVESTSMTNLAKPRSEGTPQPRIHKAMAISQPNPSEPTNTDSTHGVMAMHPMAIDINIDPMAMTSAAATQPVATDPRIALFETSQSVFKRHCYNCHGATKQKGGYRLDTKHSIYLGGKSDLPAVVPGNAEESELMYRMQLPRHDDDTMPPEEKGAVSPADIKSVWQWIEAGAYWPDESELSHAVGEYIKIGDANTYALIELINATCAKAEYNAWSDQSVRIDLGVVDPGQLNSAINQLNQFDQKITWLDCSDLELPERFFTVVQQLKDLERLHLNGTNISDEQLKVLSKLAKIRYLNLYNTTISDAGLRILQNFSNLEKVYLSQTKVSNQGIAQLQRAKPSLHIIHR